ncbi:hypothetical protein MnTg02_01299 [bacterium MnTg02]|nr:hypothetical protein MnTg02_01299 [bacterium MnTg02]
MFALAPRLPFAKTDIAGQHSRWKQFQHLFEPPTPAKKRKDYLGPF